MTMTQGEAIREVLQGLANITNKRRTPEQSAIMVKILRASYELEEAFSDKARKDTEPGEQPPRAPEV